MRCAIFTAMVTACGAACAADMTKEPIKIKPLTADQAGTLALKAGFRELEGLTTTSDKPAEVMAEHDAWLYVNGLTILWVNGQGPT